MTNGNDELLELLKRSDQDADYLERMLPNISDDIRALIKCVKTYDKNQKKFIKYVINSKRVIKSWQKITELMATYLNPMQLNYVKKYINKLRKEAMADDTE